VRKASAGETAMSGDSARRALGLCKRGSVAGYRVQSGKGIDHPAVLACVEMFVDAGKTDGAALFVAPREEGCVVSPGDHIGIMAEIKTRRRGW
jgi:hypothetical protein